MARQIEDKLFLLDQSKNKLTELTQTTYSALGLQENNNLHKWLADHIDALGEDLLVVQREHVAVNETMRRPDIVALDSDGQIVVVEVKRESASAGVVWQSVVYASYYQAYAPSDIVNMYRDFEKLEPEEARNSLLQHTESEDIADLNSNQRIILVAPGFEPEVISAAMWLGDHGVDMTCIEFRPYRDEQNDRVLIHLNVVIPLPTREEIGVTAKGSKVAERSALVVNRNVQRNDSITRYMLDLKEAAYNRLDQAPRPSRWSRWAGVENDRRWFILWFDETPWVNHHFCFKVWKIASDDDEYLVEIEFHVWRKGTLDNGASEADITHAYELASSFANDNKGWTFIEPPPKKSFTVKRRFTPSESEKIDLVAEELAKLIGFISPEFLADTESS